MILPVVQHERSEGILPQPQLSFPLQIIRLFNRQERFEDSDPWSPQKGTRTVSPPDIWYLIAYDYLVDFPATVAALSSTSRTFHTLLRPLKFRRVSIRFNTSLASLKTKSSAQRFAEKIQDESGIVNHIEVMEIGCHTLGKPYVGVPAVDDGAPPNARERGTFCTILSQPYPKLKRLALSIFRDSYVFHIPADVLTALLSVVSIQTLQEVSFVAATMPPQLFYSLQQIDTLNLRSPYLRAKPSNSVTTTKCAPRTLRIITVATVRELFPHNSPHLISLERLTTLDIRIDQRSVGVYVPWSFSSCHSTLINLKIFFDPWHRFNQGSDTLDLGKFTVLKTLTLGFNLSRSSPRLESTAQQLRLVIDALRTVVEAEQPLKIEFVSILIDNIKSSAGWIEILDGLPWSHLKTLFSPEYMPLCWSQLQEVNISVAAKKKNALSSSNRALLEKTLTLRLANGSTNGLFRVLVHGGTDSVEFD
ncbi:hypothetical protein CPB84DRAFT_1851491 [Gymnopilus junonius]|uniref:Uncharacterized protein n=1 Tax=Gymnopilus junonius TaxID=109634 RepID=A0A9P5TIW1_GYMJU|nr:hypothetical protein CPB84DRAFT_1851491 [Gymnopilus junonius]